MIYPKKFGSLEILLYLLLPCIIKENEGDIKFICKKDTTKEIIMYICTRE